MLIELKKAIFDYMCGNADFQIVNNTVKKFRQYIYTPEGEFCIGGKKVHDFIVEVDKLLRL